jgi:large conductance mechanosensitive channel
MVKGFTKNMLAPFIATIFRQPCFYALTFNTNGSKFLFGGFINTLNSLPMIATAGYLFLDPLDDALVATTRIELPAKPTAKSAWRPRWRFPSTIRRCGHCTLLGISGCL